MAKLFLTRHFSSNLLTPPLLSPLLDPSAALPFSSQRYTRAEFWSTVCGFERNDSTYPRPPVPFGPLTRLPSAPHPLFLTCPHRYTRAQIFGALLVVVGVMTAVAPARLFPWSSRPEVIADMALHPHASLEAKYVMACVACFAFPALASIIKVRVGE